MGIGKEKEQEANICREQTRNLLSNYNKSIKKKIKGCKSLGSYEAFNEEWAKNEYLQVNSSNKKENFFNYINILHNPSTANQQNLSRNSYYNNVLDKILENNRNLNKKLKASKSLGHHYQESPTLGS